MQTYPDHEKLLVIPSAKLVPLELQAEFGAIPSCMMPLACQPALRYIAMPYVNQGFEVLVPVHQQASQVNTYLQNHPELNARSVAVGETGTLGETILNTLNSLDTLPGHLVINFGDTCVEEMPQGDNTIFYQRQQDVYRWTTFQQDAHNQLTRVFDRNQEKPDTGELLVFVGVFAIGDPQRFLTLLNQFVVPGVNPFPTDTTEPVSTLDPFYQTLIAYFNELPENRKTFQQATDWRDFGHLDTYHATKKKFCMNQRYFNQVTVDGQRGIVRKSSQDVQKFIHEINWYLRLPKTIKYMAPRVFDFSLDPAAPFVEMEFYGYPALNDLYLFGDGDMGVWYQIFTAIQHLLEEMHQYHLKPEGQDTLKGAMQDIYIEKTCRRLQSVLNDERFAPFIQDTVVLNNQHCTGLHQALHLLPELAEAVNLYTCEQFTIIHGDLCLSNILYDRANRLIRVIDPRGTFGVFDIYGDPRYDLAKLSHSLAGDYDFYSNGLFHSGWTAGRFFFKPQLEERHQRIKALFSRQLIHSDRPDYWSIKLIESLLFLSMVPLHADKYASQQVFLAQGLTLFTQVAQHCLQKHPDLQKHPAL
jgi:hypothetical protein